MDTIVVKNMAGNTDAIPAKIGYPSPDIHADNPTANPANSPLDSKTMGLTGRLPFGAGIPSLHAQIPNPINIDCPMMPTQSTFGAVTRAITSTNENAQSAHTDNEAILIVSSLVYKDN